MTASALRPLRPLRTQDMGDVVLIRLPDYVSSAPGSGPIRSTRLRPALVLETFAGDLVDLQVHKHPDLDSDVLFYNSDEEETLSACEQASNQFNRGFMPKVAFGSSVWQWRPKLVTEPLLYLDARDDQRPDTDEAPPFTIPGLDGEAAREVAKASAVGATKFGAHAWKAHAARGYRNAAAELTDWTLDDSDELDRAAIPALVADAFIRLVHLADAHQVNPKVLGEVLAVRARELASRFRAGNSR